MESILKSKDCSKEEVFHRVSDYLISSGFTINKVDDTRPWGGFFVIQEQQIKKFRDAFFADVVISEEQLEQKLSPKFLLVAPNARLSWQYHFRRAELWKLLDGRAGIVRSETDEQGEEVEMAVGKIISLKQGERHRLTGKDSWGIVAEIWMHTDPAEPSNEEDIVRLEDDYSRK